MEIIVTSTRQSSQFRTVLTSVLVISLVLSSSILFSPLSIVHASVISPAPVLGGWGGARLADTAQNPTAPDSLVFPGERQSNFEQIALREFQLGYNTVRASFAPYCSVLYGLNTIAVPQDFIGTGSGSCRALSVSYGRGVSKRSTSSSYCDRVCVGSCGGAR